MSENKNVTPITNMKQIVKNVSQSIRYEFSRALGISHGGRRDLYDVYGYDQKLRFERIFQYARREGIANRVAFGIPKSCWRNGFEIIDESTEEASNEADIIALNKRGLVSRLERADILNRIGNFSVLFVGVPDGREPSQPLGRANPAKLGEVYFKPFGYDGIQVTQFVTDPKNPRYGLPKMYQVQVMDRGDNDKDTTKSALNVHWSRIIHLNENALDSDIEGMPALEPIFNRILDIDKATGGAAEAYFRNASPKYAFEIDPEFASDITDDEKEQFDEAAKKFTNDMQNMIRTAGTSVKTLPTPHHSPLDTVKTALWAISGNTGIPLRILTGEGSGQLAGSEDKLAYNSIINDRQTVKCSQWVEAVLVILANANMIKLPEVYTIEWPKEEAQSQKEEAEINEINSRTFKNIVDAKSTVGGDAINLEAMAKDFGIELIEEKITDDDNDLDDPDELEIPK